MAGRLLAVALAMWAALVSPTAGRADQAVESQDESNKILEEFVRRVAAYAELHRRLEQTLVPLDRQSDPAAIGVHQRTLAGLIRRERRSAKQGDLLFGDLRALFRRVIAAALVGEEGLATRREILEESPRGNVRLFIGGAYPADFPVSTVPPTLLERLPRLPAEVEYRFLGRTLILRDSHADTVVDYMSNAFR